MAEVKEEIVSTLFGDEVIFNGVPMMLVEEVFDYWVRVMDKKSSTILDDTRKRKIAASIKRRGVDECKKAVDGCLLSSWHMGANPRGKKYNDITLILRSADFEERFIEAAEQHEEGEDDLQQWLSED